MTGFDDLLARNREFARTEAAARLTALPSQRVLVVSCVDPRADPAVFLGVRLGDATVLRNPGGRVTTAVIMDVALSTYLSEFVGGGGPAMEVAVIHHTGCALGLFSDDEFRAGFAARSGRDDADLAALAITDPRESVAFDVRRLLSSPLTVPGLTVSGHVLDLATGLVATAVPATAAGTG